MMAGYGTSYARYTREIVAEAEAFRQGDRAAALSARLRADEAWRQYCALRAADRRIVSASVVGGWR